MMREVMQNSGLAIFAEIGLIIFMIVFVVWVIRAVTMNPKDVEHAERLPLDEGEPVTTTRGGAS